jgi:outer membrane protein TolC
VIGWWCAIAVAAESPVDPPLVTAPALASEAASGSPGGALSLAELLGAVDERVPQLAAAAAKIEAAEAKVMSRQGAFDPRIDGKTGAYRSDYSRGYGEVEWTVPTAYGPSASLGWQVGLGEFPAYDGDRKTVSLGEATVSVAMPLLQGLGMSPERAALLVAERAVAQQVAVRDDKRLEVRQKATESWWKWAGAGARLEVERSLFELAQSRQSALDRQVELGALAPIDALDHRRALEKRRADRIAAEQEVIAAAAALSLWYRDADGAPIVPTVARLPDLPRPPPETAPSTGDIDRALAGRPDLLAFDAWIEAVEVERRAALNLRLPEVDLSGQVLHGLGPEGDTEWIGGVGVKVPVLFRKGRGELGVAEATLAQLRAERQGLADRVAVEVLSARTARDAAAERSRALDEAAARAEEVARLEQRSFDLGSSDLFRVLLREATLAEAARDSIKERVNWGVAEAAWRAAVGELEPLTASEPARR